MSTRPLRIEFYRSTKDRQWRWRAIRNGHTLADSGQGYSRRIDALHGMCSLFRVARWLHPEARGKGTDRTYCVTWNGDETYAQARLRDSGYIELFVVAS